MEDKNIVTLYEQRSEKAIAETREKYGSYCSSIAYSILGSFEEAEECVSDTYLALWNAIPPAKPENFKAYCGKIIHNLALNRYRASKAQKRSSFTEVLEELEIPVLEGPEDALRCKELSAAISAFLRTLPPQKRRLFLLRYWHYLPISDISQETGLRPDKLSVELYRIRNKLKHYLEQEGFDL
jgi:RNA polymerase sigma-70 factor (ECF subfamily)